MRPLANGAWLRCCALVGGGQKRWGKTTAADCAAALCSLFSLGLFSLMWRTKKMELLKKEAKAAEAQKKQ